MALVNRLTLNAKWYDHACWFCGSSIIGVIGVGIMNGIYYNNHRIR